VTVTSSWSGHPAITALGSHEHRMYPMLSPKLLGVRCLQEAFLGCHGLTKNPVSELAQAGGSSWFSCRAPWESGSSYPLFQSGKGVGQSPGF
jgi:hypothetical protein